MSCRRPLCVAHCPARITVAAAIQRVNSLARSLRKFGLARIAGGNQALPPPVLQDSEEDWDAVLVVPPLKFFFSTSLEALRPGVPHKSKSPNLPVWDGRLLRAALRPPKC